MFDDFALAGLVESVRNSFLYKFLVACISYNTAAPSAEGRLFKLLQLRPLCRPSSALGWQQELEDRLLLQLRLRLARWPREGVDQN